MKTLENNSVCNLPTHEIMEYSGGVAAPTAAQWVGIGVGTGLMGCVFGLPGMIYAYYNALKD